jgi:hypothetical protein
MSMMGTGWEPNTWAAGTWAQDTWYGSAVDTVVSFFRRARARFRGRGFP